MKIYAKNKIVKRQPPAEWAPEFEFLNTESARRYAGIRIFRMLNRPKIRQIMNAAKFPENFK